jgi:hypothetical protein
MYREWNQEDRNTIKKALRAAVLKLVPAGLPLAEVDRVVNKGFLALVSHAGVVSTVPEGVRSVAHLNKQNGRRWVTARAANEVAIFGDPEDVLAPGSAAAYLIDEDDEGFDVVIGWTLPLE